MPGHGGAEQVAGALGRGVDARVGYDLDPRAGDENHLHLARGPGGGRRAGDGDPFGVAGQQAAGGGNDVFDIMHRPSCQVRQFKIIGRQPMGQRHQALSVGLCHFWVDVDSVVVVAHHGINDNAQAGVLGQHLPDPALQHRCLRRTAQVSDQNGFQVLQCAACGQVLQIAAKPFDRQGATVDRRVMRRIAVDDGWHDGHRQAQRFQGWSRHVIADPPVDHLRLHRDDIVQQRLQRCGGCRFDHGILPWQVSLDVVHP